MEDGKDVACSLENTCMLLLAFGDIVLLDHRTLEGKQIQWNRDLSFLKGTEKTNNECRKTINPNTRCFQVLRSPNLFKRNYSPQEAENAVISQRNHPVDVHIFHNTHATIAWPHNTIIACLTQLLVDFDVFQHEYTTLKKNYFLTKKLYIVLCFLAEFCIN